MSPACTIDIAAGITARVPFARALSKRDIADLEFAMVTGAEGFGEIGRDTVATCEAMWAASERRRLSSIAVAVAGLREAAAVAQRVVGRLDGLADALDRRKPTPPAPPSAEAVSAEVWTNTLIRRFDKVQAEIVALKARPPSKSRDKAIAEAVAARHAVEDQIETHHAEVAATARREELAALERLRGGDLVTESRTIETPRLVRGALVWDRGRQEMETKVVISDRLTARDGLESLATAHLTSDGSWRMVQGAPLEPALTNIQYAALCRYREAYDKSDPEQGLKAVDPSSAGGGRVAFDPKRWGLDAKLGQRALDRKKDGVGAMERHVQQYAGETALRILREVVGRRRTIRSLSTSGRRQQIRFAKALRDAADLLADHFGLQ